MNLSLEIALYGSNLIENDYHADGLPRISESLIRNILGPIDIYDPRFVSENLGLSIPLCESYGEYSPQFRSMILLEAGRLAAFWSSAVEKLGDAADAAGDFLKDKYEKGKEAAKEKVDDFKDATVGFAKKLGAFTQVMWKVTTGGKVKEWINALKWQVKKLYKWFKAKFDKLKAWMQQYSWLDFIRKPVEWVWEKLTLLVESIRGAEGWKGALAATGALAGISIIKEKVGEKIEDLFTSVDKALAGTSDTAGGGLVDTAKGEIEDKVKEEIAAMFKDTFVGEIYGYVKGKIEEFMSTAAMSAVTGGWAAYKDTLTKAYGAIDTVLGAIEPALSRAGGIKGVGGGIHDVQLDHLKRSGGRLTEASLRSIVRNQILAELKRKDHDQSWRQSKSVSQYRKRRRRS